MVKILYHETIFIFTILQRGVYFTGGGDGMIFDDMGARPALVHLNFRAGSTFPVPVCPLPSLWAGLAGARRLTRSEFMLHIG